MTNKSTKRALLSSAIALCLCFVMLVGTTFAWFTDEVTSSGNIIKTGKLDVTLNWSANGTDWNNVEDKDANGNHTPIFDYVLWEPGYTQVRYLEVANNGTLALKYQLQIISQSALTETVENYGDVRLSDVIDVYYATAQVDVPDRDLKNNSNLRYLGTLTDFVNAGSIIADELLPEQKDYATLVLQMQTSAGNEYQNLTVGTSFDIRLFATQYTHEEDSFDKLYDEGAQFSGLASPTDYDDNTTAVDISVFKNGTNQKYGSVNVTKKSLANTFGDVEVTMTPSNYVGNFTVDNGLETIVLDINVTGLKENNNDPVKVEVYIGEGFDQRTIALYHYDEPVTNFIYDDVTGYVIFETLTFSPFTFVFDADSVAQYPTVDYPDDLPQLSLTYAGADVGSDIEWGKYGQWSPNSEIVDQYGNPSLEAAFDFKAIDTSETVLNSPYRDWYCDFVVMLDKDLDENEIFLGGHYGSFGWVGFHNYDLKLEAETEVELLGSVTSNPWTYEDVVGLVGEFKCGVSDVNNALEGATFTVMLRLTNPENKSEFYNVATVTFKFGGENSDGIYTIHNVNPVVDAQ